MRVAYYMVELQVKAITFATRQLQFIIITLASTSDELAAESHITRCVH